MERKAGKIISTTFWVVMAIHIVVFTAVGITTSRWTLLLIFIPGVIIIMVAKQLLIRYAKQHPEKEKLRRWLLPKLKE